MINDGRRPATFTPLRGDSWEEEIARVFRSSLPPLGEAASAQFQISNFKFQVSSFKFQVSSFQFPLPIRGSSPPPSRPVEPPRQASELRQSRLEQQAESLCFRRRQIVCEFLANLIFVQMADGVSDEVVEFRTGSTCEKVLGLHPGGVGRLDEALFERRLVGSRIQDKT